MSFLESYFLIKVAFRVFPPLEKAEKAEVNDGENLYCKWLDVNYLCIFFAPQIGCAGQTRLTVRTGFSRKTPQSARWLVADTAPTFCSSSMLRFARCDLRG